MLIPLVQYKAETTLLLWILPQSDRRYTICRIWRLRIQQENFRDVLLVPGSQRSQFMSSAFKRLYCENGITHLWSPPYHPQSNGQIERFMDTIKRATINGGEGVLAQVINNFLMSYRVTPNPAVPEGKSLVECMFGRKVRTVSNSMLPSRKTNKPSNEDRTVIRSFQVD